MVFWRPLGPSFVNCERDNQDGRDPKVGVRRSEHFNLQTALLVTLFS
jgi:hypothetical protein